MVSMEVMRVGSLFLVLAAVPWTDTWTWNSRETQVVEQTKHDKAELGNILRHPSLFTDKMYLGNVKWFWIKNVKGQIILKMI